MQFTTLIVAAVALVQGASASYHAHAHHRHPALAVPGVLRRADAGFSVMKREGLTCPEGETICGSRCSAECCDADTGLSCRAGEYCVTLTGGSIGCCPEGKTCNSIRPCINRDAAGCENGGTVDGKLCCDTETPFCNTLTDGTQFCEAKPQPIVTSTAVEIVTVTNTPVVPVTSTITSTTTICPEQPVATCDTPAPHVPTWNNGTVTHPVPVYPEETPVVVTPPGNNVTIPEVPEVPVEEEPEVPGAPEVPEESTGGAAVLKGSMGMLAGVVVAAMLL